MENAEERIRNRYILQQIIELEEKLLADMRLEFDSLVYLYDKDSEEYKELVDSYGMQTAMLQYELNNHKTEFKRMIEEI